MGLFSFLFGQKRLIPRARSGTLIIAGSGEYNFDIVGESHYQDVLSLACGGKCEDGHELRVAVSIEPEPENPHDHQAVRVALAGHTIGHLSRADAIDYLVELEEAGYAGWTAECFAHIVGGWQRVNSEGHFGVKLDIDFPPDFRFAAD